MKHLTKISDLNKEECLKIIELAVEIKANGEKFRNKLRDKNLLMIFEKPSLRTRVSFEVGMTQLGGHAIFYPTRDGPFGKKENIHDTAKCVSRYVDIIGARVYRRDDILELVNHSEVPVINMLDDYAHPCQILADFMTIYEKKESKSGRYSDYFSGLKLSYFGDAHNNVTYDLMRICAMFGMKMDVSCPEGIEYSPEEAVLEEIKEISKMTNAKVEIVHDAKWAALNADIIYTDSWMSYGIPAEKEMERKKVFMPFQVTDEILKASKPDSVFMNCLPAMRGYEQTADVIDGEQSIVFDQAENRLYIQKAILLYLLEEI